MDQDEEERERGITITYSKGYFQTKNKKFTVLDTPGQRNFIPNMIDGASQAECAILAVDSRQGYFESAFQDGETKKHAILAKTVGVN